MISTLGGTTTFSGINLCGNHTSKNNSIPDDILRLKELVLENFIFPIERNQWDLLDESIHMSSKIKKKLKHYYNLYKIPDLNLYLHIIILLEKVIDNRKVEFDNNNLIYNKNKKSEEIIKMMFQTSAIKLRPEYEIYNSIIGKPDLLLKQTYKTNIINDIKTLFYDKNVSYFKIKEIIQTKYKK